MIAHTQTIFVNDPRGIPGGRRHAELPGFRHVASKR